MLSPIKTNLGLLSGSAAGIHSVCMGGGLPSIRTLGAVCGEEYFENEVKKGPELSLSRMSSRNSAWSSNSWPALNLVSKRSFGRLELLV